VVSSPAELVQADELGVAIAPEPAIPPKFPTDRRFMHVQYGGHLGLVLSGFHQGLNLIPLFPG
jgi:hypothetical protein